MENETQNVVITDVKMPFFSMVMFMVKWTLASIPAVIILMILFAVIGAGLFFVLGMLGIDMGSMLGIEGEIGEMMSPSPEP
jgi:5-bromo-4-chloroindolyl phosphate hydrolysis protein